MKMNSKIAEGQTSPPPPPPTPTPPPTNPKPPNTGMHSGLLFLFPHIFKVVTAAEECKSSDFDARLDMWFNPDPFTCPDHVADGTDKFWYIFLKVLPACFIWGVGTAAGEIPPYALSRAGLCVSVCASVCVCTFKRRREVTCEEGREKGVAWSFPYMFLSCRSWPHHAGMRTTASPPRHFARHSL